MLSDSPKRCANATEAANVAATATSAGPLDTRSRNAGNRSPISIPSTKNGKYASVIDTMPHRVAEPATNATAASPPIASKTSTMGIAGTAHGAPDGSPFSPLTSVPPFSPFAPFAPPCVRARSVIADTAHAISMQMNSAYRNQNCPNGRQPIASRSFGVNA